MHEPTVSTNLILPHAVLLPLCFLDCVLVHVPLQASPIVGRFLCLKHHAESTATCSWPEYLTPERYARACDAQRDCLKELVFRHPLFRNMLRVCTGGNTRQFGWETQNTPFNLAFVYGITFSGNNIGDDSSCTQNLANYAVRCPPPQCTLCTPNAWLHLSLHVYCPTGRVKHDGMVFLLELLLLAQA